MALFTTITTKGQITLPIELRRRLHVRPGMKVTLSYQNDSIVIHPAVDLDDLRARAKAHMKKRGIGPITEEQIDNAWASSVTQKHKKAAA
ncbi:MAG TPA: AbrB/MazE/SpoVT family DNA-binding domain-containing protein [Candidatus Acidoferrum sp.]|nr:AbrB/MazE/SpoVT family DNA-binding domain-containing protein [Candidatus Acidoferrum sp.]